MFYTGKKIVVIVTSQVHPVFVVFFFFFSFYHGTIKRSDAERMLCVFRDGSYLVRRSETSKNDYSLTMK